VWNCETGIEAAVKPFGHDCRTTAEVVKMGPLLRY